MCPFKRTLFFPLCVWICLGAQLIVSIGMAHGAVVCIAPDGHFAIESPHANSGCAAAQKDFRPVPLNSTLEKSTQRTCQDTPIFGVGSHLTIPPSVGLLPPVSQPIALLSPPLVAAHRSRLLRSSITPIPLRSLHASLRSTVLLI